LNLSHKPENRLNAPTATVHDEHDDLMNMKKASLGIRRAHRVIVPIVLLRDVVTHS
jgi:hypothetical protein